MFLRLDRPNLALIQYIFAVSEIANQFSLQWSINCLQISEYAYKGEELTDQRSV